MVDKLIVDVTAGTRQTVPLTSGEEAEAAAVRAAEVGMAHRGQLTTDRWAVPADGSAAAVVTYGTDVPVWFVIDGTAHEVDPVDNVATFEIVADGPGPIPVEVQDKRIVIVASE